MEHWKRTIERANHCFMQGELVDAREHYLQALALAQVLFERWGDADDNTPPEDNALIYRDLIPHAHGESLGSNVGHYVFLGDREDPTGVRPRVAGEAVEFFTSNL